MEATKTNGTSLQISQQQLEEILTLEERVKFLGRALSSKREFVETLLRSGVAVEDGAISAEIERKFTKVIAWKQECACFLGEQQVAQIHDAAEPKLSEKLVVRRND